MAIRNVILGSGLNTVYTSVGQTALTVVYLCNTTQNSVNVNVYAVPEGAVPDINNMIYYGVPIAGTDTYIIDTEKLIFENNDELVATTTEPGSITVTVSSMEL
jgi:hypothetical protein